MTIEITKNRKEAHGAICQDCGTRFASDTNPYWHWSKSMAMHKSGCGHKVEMYLIVVPS